MFDTVCTLPLTSDLFAQATHPTESVLAVGLSSGHVQCFRLPPVAGEDDSSNEDAAASESGCGQIETAWRTRRHKGSCRTVGFGYDGEALYSAGTDGLVKAASSETGQVFRKIAIPHDPNNSTESVDAPSLLHVLSPQTLLLATDSSALHIYDLRLDQKHATSSKPQATHHPHDDYISSLTPLPPSDASTSGFSKQWVSVGGTTLAVTDLRRGVLVRSEDQEEELLSSVFVDGFAKRGTSQGEKVLVGGGNGVVTLWERGVWDDQDERIILDRGPGGGESVDCLVRVPEGIGAGERMVVAGMGNGALALVGLGSNKVIYVLTHDEVEGVVGLGFDASRRMISGGGQTVKVWQEKLEAETEEDEEEGSTDGVAKRTAGSDSEGDSDENDSDEESEEEERSRKRRKRRKRGKGVNGVSGKSNLMFKGLD